MNYTALKNAAFLLLLPATLLFVSCDETRLFEENTEIPDSVWDMNHKVAFEVDIADTVTPHNFYINVRHSEGYPFSNIYLFITTTYPGGKKSRDTIECVLADAQGRWLGEGLGDIFDNQVPFKKNVRFPRKGRYVFEYEQAMRMEKLPLVMDVGLRIEKGE